MKLTLSHISLSLVPFLATLADDDVLVTSSSDGNTNSLILEQHDVQQQQDDEILQQQQQEEQHNHDNNLGEKVPISPTSTRAQHDNHQEESGEVMRSQKEMETDSIIDDILNSMDDQQQLEEDDYEQILMNRSVKIDEEHNNNDDLSENDDLSKVNAKEALHHEIRHHDESKINDDEEKVEDREEKEGLEKPSPSDATTTIQGQTPENNNKDKNHEEKPTATADDKEVEEEGYRINSQDKEENKSKSTVQETNIESTKSERIPEGKQVEQPLGEPTNSEGIPEGKQVEQPLGVKESGSNNEKGDITTNANNTNENVKTDDIAKQDREEFESNEENTNQTQQEEDKIEKNETGDSTTTINTPNASVGKAEEDTKEKDGDDDDDSTSSDEIPDDESYEKEVFVDYANKSTGAIILDKSPEFKGTSNLLVDDKDRYAISPCELPSSSSSKFVIIGLSEDIEVKTIKLSSDERFSSQTKKFEVLGSTTYPISTKWEKVGTFEAKPWFKENVEQTFELEVPSWMRYIKLRFLTHYGVEHFCTVTQVKVFGSTAQQGFHMEWDSHDMNAHEWDASSEIDAVATAAVVASATGGIVGSSSSSSSNAGEKEAVAKSVEKDVDSLRDDSNNNGNAEIEEPAVRDNMEGVQKQIDERPTTITVPATVEENTIEHEANINDSRSEIEDDNADKKDTSTKVEKKEVTSQTGRESTQENVSDTTGTEASELMDSLSETETLQETNSLQDNTTAEVGGKLSGNSDTTNDLENNEDVDEAAISTHSPNDSLNAQKVEDTQQADVAIDHESKSGSQDVSQAISEDNDISNEMEKKNESRVTSSTSNSDDTGVPEGELNEVPTASSTDGQDHERTNEESSQKSSTSPIVEKREENFQEKNEDKSEEVQEGEHANKSNPNGDIVKESTNESTSEGVIDQVEENTSHSSSSTNNSSSHQIRNEAVASIAHQSRSKSCLESLDFQAFKAKILSTKPEHTGSGSIPAGGPKNDPIFKKLTYEIRALQTNQGIYDQYIKVMANCYEEVISDMANQILDMKVDQTERLFKIEEQMRILTEKEQQEEENSWTTILLKIVFSSLPIWHVIFAYILQMFSLLEGKILAALYYLVNIVLENEQVQAVLEFLNIHRGEIVSFFAGSCFCLVTVLIFRRSPSNGKEGVPLDSKQTSSKSEQQVIALDGSDEKKEKRNNSSENLGEGGHGRVVTTKKKRKKKTRRKNPNPPSLQIETDDTFSCESNSIEGEIR